MIKINTEQICSLVIHLNTVCETYVYKKAKYIFGYNIRLEGYYDGHKYVSVEEIEQNSDLICRDKKVFFKPYVSMKLSNGEQFTEDFETENELNEYINREEVRKIIWI